MQQGTRQPYMNPGNGIHFGTEMEHQQQYGLPVNEQFHYQQQHYPPHSPVGHPQQRHIQQPQVPAQYMYPTTPQHSQFYHQEVPQMRQQPSQQMVYYQENLPIIRQPIPPKDFRIKPLDAYLLARALQNVPPGQEHQQVILYAQRKNRPVDPYLHYYDRYRSEIDELASHLRSEYAISAAAQQEAKMLASHGPPIDVHSRPPLSQMPSHQGLPEVPSEASTPMLQTPTSTVRGSIKGSRDGEPYTAGEIELLESTVREVLQTQPDIKLAQLGIIIHNKDQARPPTAWARQLSKRKRAIDKARALARSGKDISRHLMTINKRDTRSDVESDVDSRDPPDDDADYVDDRPLKRRRGS